MLYEYLAPRTDQGIALAYVVSPLLTCRLSCLVDRGTDSRIQYGDGIPSNPGGRGNSSFSIVVRDPIEGIVLRLLKES